MQMKIKQLQLVESILKKKFESISSFNSNSYIFQVNEEKDFVIFEKKNISDFSQLKQTISMIPSPCSYKIEKSELLEKILKNEKNSIKYPNHFLMI